MTDDRDQSEQADASGTRETDQGVVLAPLPMMWRGVAAELVRVVNAAQNGSIRLTLPLVMHRMADHGMLPYAMAFCATILGHQVLSSSGADVPPDAHLLGATREELQDPQAEVRGVHLRPVHGDTMHQISPTSDGAELVPLISEEIVELIRHALAGEPLEFHRYLTDHASRATPTHLRTLTATMLLSTAVQLIEDHDHDGALTWLQSDAGAAAFLYEHVTSAIWLHQIVDAMTSGIPQQDELQPGVPAYELAMDVHVSLSGRPRPDHPETHSSVPAGFVDMCAHGTALYAVQLGIALVGTLWGEKIRAAGGRAIMTEQRGTSMWDQQLVQVDVATVSADTLPDVNDTAGWYAWLAARALNYAQDVPNAEQLKLVSSSAQAALSAYQAVVAWLAAIMRDMEHAMSTLADAVARAADESPAGDDHDTGNTTQMP